MRVVLVLCLLAFMSCQKDIMDIAKCLYENPKVKELIGDVMVAIVTKDFSKLLPKIMDSLPELIQAVITCVTGEINLQGPKECAVCLNNCKVRNANSPHPLNCMMQCYPKCLPIIPNLVEY